jgi:hypothetical protein
MSAFKIQVTDAISLIDKKVEAIRNALYESKICEVQSRICPDLPAPLKVKQELQITNRRIDRLLNYLNLEETNSPSVIIRKKGKKK